MTETRNDAAADPQQTIPELQRALAERTAERDELLQQQTATADVLEVISNSVTDAAPVFDKILEGCGRLFNGTDMMVFLVDNEILRIGAVRGPDPDRNERIRGGFPLPITGTAAELAIRERRLVTFGDVLNDPGVPHALRQIAALVGGNHSVAIAPMLWEDRAIGTIFVSRTQPMRAFNATEQRLLQTFAEQAVIAIENARLFNETKEALERQTATSNILNVIASSPTDTKPVFDAIARSAAELCEGTNSGVFRLQDGLVHLAGHHNLSPEQLAFVPKVFPAPPHRGYMAGRAIIDRAVAHVPDIAADPEYSAESIVKAGFRSAVSVPMFRNCEPIGAINVTREEARPFSNRQIELLRTFADQAVIAIENTRLFNETQQALEQQKASADILAVISSSVADAQPVFDKILVSCKHLFGGDELDVLLVDEQGQLNIAAYIGDSHDVVAATFPAPVERTPAGRAIRERRVMHWPDLIDGEDVPGVLRKMAKLIGYRSMVFAPMLWEGRGIGAIGVARSTGPFKPKELAMIQIFADQAVIAIQNARLFNETREALERQTATADILKVIASSPSDVQPVFYAIANRSKQLIGGFSCTVFRLIDGIVHLVAYTSVNAAADQVLKASFPRPVGEMSLFDMAKGRDVFEEPDAEENPDARLRELARARGFRSTLFARLMNKATPIGLIAVTRTQPGSFDPHHVQLLRTFADQAVIAIENARLFEEVQQRTRELEESLQQQTATSQVLQVISSSPGELNPVFQTMLTNAMQLCEASHGVVWLREGDGFRSAALQGPWPEGFVEQWRSGTPVRPGPDAPITRAAVTGKAVQTPDLSESPAYRKGDPLPVAAVDVAGIRTVLSVPMFREAEFVGAIALSRREVRLFTDKQVDLVANFAKQAVIAVENARLLGELRQRTVELSQLLDDLRNAQDRLVQTEKLASLGQLTAGIAHEIKNPLNFVNNFSALSAELVDELDETLVPAPLDRKMRDDVGELTGMLKSNLEKIVQHGKRADSIVKNMLQHSREGSGELRSVDINALVGESLNLAYHGARAEKPGFAITLRHELDPGAGALEPYPQEITRALLNLISNGFYAAVARKAETDDSAFEPTLSAATRNLGATVEIRIRDNGAGIPPEVREKMFNPFFTTKPTGEGTGLGLSMTHDIIVKQHGGRIDVQTEPGAFAEFIITLPRGNGTVARSKPE